MLAELYENSITTNISLDELKEGSISERLKNMAIDKGSNFLSGQATSAFTKLTAPGEKYTTASANAYNSQLEGALSKNGTKTYLTLDDIYKYNIKLSGAKKIKNIEEYQKNGILKSIPVDIIEQHEDLDNAIMYNVANDSSKVTTLIINLYNSKLKGAKKAGDINNADPKNLYTSITGATLNSATLARAGLEMWQGEEAQKLLEEVMEIIVSKVTQAIQKLIFANTKKIQLEVLNIPSKILMYTNKWLEIELSGTAGATNEDSLTNILADLTKEDPTQELAEKNKKEKEEKENKTKEKILKTLTEITTTINEYSGYINGIALEGMRYIDEGPDFVIDNVNKYVNIAYNYIENQVNDEVNVALNELNKTCESIGESAGKEAGKLVKNEAKKTVKYLLQKQETQLTKGKVLVSSAKIKAFNALAAKLGL